MIDSVGLHQMLLNLFPEASRVNNGGSVSHHSWYSSFGSHRTWMQCPEWGKRGHCDPLCCPHSPPHISPVRGPTTSKARSWSGCCPSCSYRRWLRWVGTGGISSSSTRGCCACFTSGVFTDQVKVSEMCTPRNLMLWMTTTAVLLSRGKSWRSWILRWYEVSKNRHLKELYY